MRSERFNGGPIGGALPVTILGPMIEACLRSARVQHDRKELLDRFTAGQPRVAVVHGSGDHPCSVGIGCRELIRRLIGKLWAESALPVQVSLAVPCEELSESLVGPECAFLGRNICAANFSMLMEAHGYDAAVVVAACDKLSVGVLRALIEADLARQERGARPVHALVIPPSVAREVHFGQEEKGKFELLRQKLPEPEWREIFDLLDQPVEANGYGKMQVCLDRALRKRVILEAEKNGLEEIVAMRTLASGAMCASSEASIVNRLMLATFGIVPRHLDLTANPPSDPQLSKPIRRMIQALRKRERRSSVSHLVKTNLQNSVAVWGATGGNPSWLLHVNYLAEALGGGLSAALLKRKMLRVPRLFSLSDHDGLSTHGFIAEAESGANSGIDTLMRTLSEKRLIDDRAATVDGAWMKRIKEARSADGRYFHSTMTPHAPTSGLVRVRGNLFTEALVCCCDELPLSEYDNKVYFADFFLGRDQFANAFRTVGTFLDRIKSKVTREDLYRAWCINWKDSTDESSNLSGWSKQRLWDYLVEKNLLRCALFVAGEGPRASGMPRIAFPESTRFAPIRKTCVLATDGRVRLATDMMSIVHIVPEAIEGGRLAALRTGDWVYLNLRKGEFQLVKATRAASGFRVVSEREISRRSDIARRVQELARRRRSLLPSVRSVLDQVSSAADGLSPLTH
jgi:dihydroxy-acid dehydratase